MVTNNSIRIGIHESASICDSVFSSDILYNLSADRGDVNVGMKVLLSLADNWKYAGGADQYVDWSPTTAERGAANQRPPDEEGDTDNTVRLKLEPSQV